MFCKTPFCCCLMYVYIDTTAFGKLFSMRSTTSRSEIALHASLTNSAFPLLVCTLVRIADVSALNFIATPFNRKN